MVSAPRQLETAVSGKLLESRTFLQRLGKLAVLSGTPGLLGGAVCVLSLVMLPTLGFDIYFSANLPASPLLQPLFTAVPLDASNFAAGVRGRLAFGLSSISLIVTVLGVAIAASVVIRTVLVHEGENFGQRVLQLTIGGAGVAFVLSLLFQLRSRGTHVLAMLLSSIQVEHRSVISLLVMALNSLIVSATILLAVGFSILTVPSPSDMGPLPVFAERMRLLRNLLYVGSACLVSRVLEIYTFYMWTTSQVAGEKALSVIAWSTSAAVGAIFTLFLAVTYLPAAAAMSEEIQQWQAQNLSGDDALRLDTAKDGTGGTFKDFRKVLAILSPLLVGLLPGPMEAVLKKVLGQ